MFLKAIHHSDSSTAEQEYTRENLGAGEPAEEHLTLAVSSAWGLLMERKKVTTSFISSGEIITDSILPLLPKMFPQRQALKLITPTRRLGDWETDCVCLEPALDLTPS
ncbi:Uncharacterized protein DAT39_005684 [Clarias magur]|uniref:Uncharacterized protein n=1 Tax=Clarias magur TaxID=1594786 RepID=A0A8J4X7H9_CLAMG|nr:Uncharacterized protein DAT39_005684 [Clarias magur]